MASKRLTPIQAIKKKCREDCCINNLDSWKNCSVVKCPLYPYRLGKRPKTIPFQDYTKKRVVSLLKIENKRVLGVDLKDD